MSRLLGLPVDVDDEGQGRGDQADLDDDVGDDEALGGQDAVLGERRWPTRARLTALLMTSMPMKSLMRFLMVSRQ